MQTEPPDNAPSPSARKYHRPEGLSGPGDLLRRFLWGVVWALLFRPTPRRLHGWRRVLLRLFGAEIGRGVRVYPSVKVWAPWNLRMADGSALGPHVDCYCVDRITLGERAIVSQYSYLCSAGHDHTLRDMPTITAPITVGTDAWVCADVFVAPGVTIGAGAVVGARSAVFKDVAAWTVVGGNPAAFIKPRVFRDALPPTAPATEDD